MDESMHSQVSTDEDVGDNDMRAQAPTPEPKQEPPRRASSDDPTMERAIELCGCVTCVEFGGTTPPGGERDPGCRAHAIWSGMQEGIEREKKRRMAEDAETRRLREKDPMYADRRDRDVLYILHEEGLPGAAHNTEIPEGAKLVKQVPLNRLTDTCAVAALVRGELREPVRVEDHWNEHGEYGAGLVITNTFVSALGKSCLPLVIRIRNGVLSLPAA